MIKKVFSGLACALIAFLAVTGCSMDPAADAGADEAAAVDRAVQTTSTGVKIIKKTVYVNSASTGAAVGAFRTCTISLNDFEMPDLISPDYDEEFFKTAYIEVAAYGYEYGGDGIISFDNTGVLAFSADQYNIPPLEVDLVKNVKDLQVSTSGPTSSPHFAYAQELPGLSGASPRYRLGHGLLSSNEDKGHVEISLGGNYKDINPGDTFEFQIRIYATRINTTPDEASYNYPVLKAVYHYTICFVGEKKMALTNIDYPNSVFYSNYPVADPAAPFYPSVSYRKEHAVLRNMNGERCWLYVYEKNTGTLLASKEIEQGVINIPLSSLSCYQQMKTGTSYLLFFRKEEYDTYKKMTALVEGGMIFIPC
jgi:hypothetical protein